MGNKVIRICIVGAGRVGKVHAHSIWRHIPAGKVVAIVDPVAEAREALADQFGVERRYNSLEDALEKADFEAVVITTPTPTHKPLAFIAASRGKHIFLEKPMALTLADCDAILASTRQAGLILQIGFMRRFDPEFTAAAQRIQAGEIGRPMMVKSLTHGPGLPPPWARVLRLSNGMLAEVNSHDWDTVRWLMASNYDRIYTEVAHLTGPAKDITEPDFYDNALVNLRFENGGLGMISGICPCGYGYDARVEIYGDRGVMQIGELQGQAVVVCTDREHGLVTPIYRTWPERFAWGYIYEMEHFIQCLLTETSPRASGEDGRWAVAGVLAATRSFQEQRPVYLAEILSN